MDISETLEIYVTLGLGVVSLWLVILTLLFFLFRNKMMRLITFEHEDQILTRLSQSMEKVAIAEEMIRKFEQRLAEFAEYQKTSFSRMGLVRFNPYDDMGSDQSFVLALLDDDGNGIVLSSLHARDRTRTYIKPIQHGVAVGYELSAEEQESLLIALKSGTT